MTTSDSHGIATTTEYMLLLGISTAIFLALSMAFSAFAATARDDAVAISACQIGSAVSAAIGETVGSGDVSGTCMLDIPERVCGMPYLVYPSQDGKSVCVRVNRGREGYRYHAPLLLRKEGILVDGFIASPQQEHVVSYDARSKAVTIS